MLQIYKDFFKVIESHSINLVYFKSSPALKEALSGVGDLDVYTSVRNRDVLRKLLLQCGFREAFPSPVRIYNDVDNFIGACSDSGNFAHLHIHYRVLVGPDYAKKIILPHSTVFSNKTLTPNSMYPSFQLIAPSDEMRLSEQRLLLKIRLKDFFRATKKLESLVAEMTKISKNHGISCNAYAQHICDGVRYKKRVAVYDFFNLIRNPNSFWSVSFHKWIWLKIIEVAGRIANRYIDLLKPLDKRMDLRTSEGVVIAFVGCDGAGKSGLMESASRYIGQRINVRTFHFGKPSNFFGYASRKIAVVFSKISSGESPDGKINKIIFGTRALLVAIGRYLVSQKAKANAMKGKVVFVDRYYLEEIGLDGGRDLELLELNFGIKSYLYRLVASFYSKMPDPNLLIVVHAPLDDIVKRRPSDSLEGLQYKVAKINTFLDTISDQHPERKANINMVSIKNDSLFKDSADLVNSSVVKEVFYD